MFHAFSGNKFPSSHLPSSSYRLPLLSIFLLLLLLYLFLPFVVNMQKFLLRIKLGMLPNFLILFC